MNRLNPYSNGYWFFSSGLWGLQNVLTKVLILILMDIGFSRLSKVSDEDTRIRVLILILMDIGFSLQTKFVQEKKTSES